MGSKIGFSSDGATKTSTSADRKTFLEYCIIVPSPVLFAEYTGSLTGGITLPCCSLTLEVDAV